jgi:hypothetical protein
LPNTTLIRYPGHNDEKRTESSIEISYGRGKKKCHGIALIITEISRKIGVRNWN